MLFYKIPYQRKALDDLGKEPNSFDQVVEKWWGFSTAYNEKNLWADAVEDIAAPILEITEHAIETLLSGPDDKKRTRVSLIS